MSFSHRHQRSDRPGASINVPAIAIIGMSGQFPGARNLEQFWQNLVHGRQSIQRLSDDDLREQVGSAELLQDPRLIRYKGLLADAEAFDAHFFAYRPQEAITIDPQQRLFLEHAYASLESAGYPPQTHDRVVGVFGGVSMNSYVHRLYRAGRGRDPVDGYQVLLGNDKDHLATRVSYKLNLRGPSLTIQTACSTSLVAVERACRSLAGYECDLAVAGGASLAYPRKAVSLFHESMILSPDGKCRAFDASASGTVVGEGVGVAVLKRLDEALSDRDPIVAVIRGWATNNDGSSKPGYTAPSIAGQAEVIAMAQQWADVDPATISFVEAHGSGTQLGDAVELEALRQAFERHGKLRGTCRLASVKSNIGHLDVAAGIAGLIKTALCLRHGALPATLHYQQPNARIDLEQSPFVINGELRPWPPGRLPRRAGVSSFGIGGTNAHLVLEESPPIPHAESAAGPFALPLSARTESALDAVMDNLAEHLCRHDDLSMADVAFTLQFARQPFPHRRLIVCDDRQQAIDALRRRGQPPRSAAATCWPLNLASEPLQGLARAWLGGERVDWTSLQSTRQASRVQLPTYPFERQEFHIDAPPQTLPDGPHDMSIEQAGMLVHATSWRRVVTREARHAPSIEPPGAVVVFADSSDLCDEIMHQLRSRGDTVIQVEACGEFAKLHALHYRLEPGTAADYVRLLRQLDHDRLACRRIVHLWNLDERHTAGPHEPSDEILRRGFQSLVFLAQALERRGRLDPVAITVVSSQVHDVLGDETLCPPKAACLGPCLVIPQEYPEVGCRHVDVQTSRGTEPIAPLALSIAVEVRRRTNEPIVALRGRHRWVPEYEPCPLESPPGTPPLLRHRGVYLITGGLGKIGSELAGYLSRAVAARLVLTHRSPFPPIEQWDRYLAEHDENDPTAARVRRLRELLIGGSELCLIQADAADACSWKQAIFSVHQRFGKLDGIIQAAGYVEAKPIHQAAAAEFSSHFRARAMGLETLAATADQDGADFLFVNSSVASLLGGIGLCAYAASTNYADALVRWIQRGSRTQWINVNWDAWNFGLTPGASDRRERAIAPQAGVELFRRALWLEQAGPWIAATGDLSQRLQRWVKRDQPVGEPAEAAARSPRHPRPPLQTPYVAPRNELEETVAEVWRQRLGLQSVGIHDPYLDLGGDSLLAGEIVVQLRHRLELPLSLRSMFDHPTVAKLADHIATGLEPN